mgnify:FL=1
MSEIKKVKNEYIKEQSNGLRGTIKQELHDLELNKFTKDNEQVLKFHGIYQQDDRDKRKELIKQKKDRLYSFMIRTKNPGGGNISPDQWEILDEISTNWANGTLRITTRECFQFHGIGKKNLWNAVNAMNSKLISSYGACGDINRNTVASPISDLRSSYYYDASYLATEIDKATLAKSKGYYEIWVDDEKYTTNINQKKIEKDDLYGENYLPRKFKIGVGHQSDNSIDVYTQDIGIIPIFSKDNELIGFNILVGGGLGSHHNQAQTFPRLADELGMCKNEDHVIKVVRAILMVQRNHGCRTNRKRARMKYLLEEWGVDKFRKEVERFLDFKLDKFIKFSIKEIDDFYGWHQQPDKNKFFCGIFIENGRIGDTKKIKLKTGLKEIIKKFNIETRLTATQDLILVNIDKNDVDVIKELFEKYNIDTHEKYSSIKKMSMACPALPTCSLAVAEAERYLPKLLEQLENMGYGNEDIKIRMSGCPNSCSRPPVSELGLIGATLGKYNIYLGGDHLGTRLNKLFMELVEDEELPKVISKLIDYWKDNRDSEIQRFGDFYNCQNFDNLKKNIIIQK